MINNIDVPATFKISYGLYIVSAQYDGKKNGQIANVVSQVTDKPIKIVTCLNKKNLTHELVEKSGYFGVSILERDTPMPFIGHFGFKSGRDINKFEGKEFETDESGTPMILDYSVSIMSAKVVGKLDVGSHTLFVGELVSAKLINNNPVMTYEYYHEVKKGKSPENAPTFRGNIEEKKENKRSEGMKKYVCDVCGYVYDPEKGDPDSGIKPGTAFEDIPDDWVCPVCGVTKDNFSEM